MMRVSMAPLAGLSVRPSSSLRTVNNDGSVELSLLRSPFDLEVEVAFEVGVVLDHLLNEGIGALSLVNEAFRITSE
jgi:hypothetical protein